MAVAAALFSPEMISAQVATDGSLGPEVTLDGTGIEVGQGLGARMGDNLFHSFDRFSIAVDQQVTFTGDEGIDNVISRVTGGEVSTIAGTLLSEVGDEGFFFINPTGVIIEESGSIDVPAALHVSNATLVRFNDGSEWSTSDRTDATLTIASPEAFGFLGASTTGVQINGAELEVADGATLDVTGVNVAIEDAAIAVPNGQARVQAAGENGVVPASLTVESSEGALSVASSSFNGENASFLFGGGAVSFESATVGPTDFNGAPSELLIEGDALDLTEVTFSLVPDDVNSVATLALTAQGDIRIGGASNLLLSGDVAGMDTKRMLIRAGGNIAVSGGSVLENNGNFELAGGIAVQAVDMTLDDGASISSNTTSGVGGGIFIRLRNLSLNDSTIGASATEDGGIGGNINVMATGSVALDESRIEAEAFGDADGGLILISAPELTLTNGAGISAEIDDGEAGNIVIDVGNLSLNGFSTIAANANEGGGIGGTIDVMATGSVALDESTIAAAALGGADGGFILISAPELTLTSGAGISAEIDDGFAGTIDIDVGNLALSGFSSVSTKADGGAGGDINLTAANEIILNNGNITTSVTGGDENGGNVTIAVDDGFIVLHQGSDILSQARGGNGGAMQINMDALYRSRSTRIDASSTLGFDGPVVISGLENPETAETGVLPSDFLDTTAVVRNPCLAAFLGRSQLQIIETGVSAGSIQGDSPLLDAATAGGLALVGGDLSANAAGCDR